jgi:hypothetical protein
MIGRTLGHRLARSPTEPFVARYRVVFRASRISQADDMTVKYHTWLDPRTSLEELGVQLMEPGAGVKSVARERPKRESA